MKADTEQEATVASPPGTRPARLPSDSSSESPPKAGSGTQTERERKDRDAAPPPARSEEDAGEQDRSARLEDCKTTVLAHQQQAIDVSRAVREIIEGELYRADGYDDLHAFGVEVLGIGSTRLRHYRYHADVYDRIEESRTAIADRLTNVNQSEIPLPTTRGWARPLYTLENNGKTELLLDVWAAVVDRYGSELTHARVKAVRTEVESNEVESGARSGSDDSPSDDSPSDDSSPDATPSDAGASDAGASGDGASGDGDGDEATQDGGSDGKAERNGSSQGVPESHTSGGDNGQGDGSGDAPTPSMPASGAVVVPADVAGLVGAEGCEVLGTKRALPVEDLTSGDIETLLQAESDPHPLPMSSGEEALADSVWRPLTGSLTDYDAGLPEADARDLLLLHPARLGTLTSRRGVSKAEHVLVCPGVDLFSPAVPEAFAQAVLSAIEGTEIAPVLFTRHLDRAAGFDLPSELWLGTETDRERLSEVQDELSNRSGVARRWLLYDVQKPDRVDGLPSLSDEIDWICFDPPGGAGVQLTLGEVDTLTAAAEDAGATWNFRNSFTAASFTRPE